MEVPYHYSRCMIDAAACPLAIRCLRHHAWQEIVANPNETDSVKVVNPLNETIHYGTKECKRFRPNEKQRFAYGMTGLYRDVPSHLRSWVRSKVMATFSSERMYYYCRVGKFQITPEMQERIARAFRKCEVDAEPQYDRYVYEYDW